MQYLYNFNFNYLMTDEFINCYLEYLINNSGLTQKEIVKETGISQATFTRVRRQGYKSKEWVCQTLFNYFKVKEASQDVLLELNKLASKLYTIVYYFDQSEQEIIYKQLQNLMPDVENTNLEIILYALISITISQELYPKDLKMLEGKVKLIEDFTNYVPADIKFLLTYSLCEYSLHINDVKLTQKYGDVLFSLSRSLCEELEAFNDFLIMNTCFFNKDITRGINMASKVIEMQQSYFSWQIRTSAVYHLFAFYTMSRNYEKMISIAKGEILQLQFDNRHQLYYFSFMTGYASALVMVKDFKTAKEVIETIKEYDFNKINNKVYIPKLKAKINVLNVLLLFIYYKENNEEEYAKIKEEIIKETYIDDIVNLIDVLKGKSKVEKKKNLAKIEKAEYAKSLIGVTDVFYLIKEEYINILK